MLCETVRKFTHSRDRLIWRTSSFSYEKNFMEYGTQDKMALSWLIALELLAYLRKKINMW